MSTTWYRKIRPVQEPIDIGLDEDERIRMVFNIEIEKAYSTTLSDEIIQILVSAGVGTKGTNIFSGSKAVIPTGDGPYLNIVETGGAFAEESHNEVATPAIQRPTMQIFARAKQKSDADTMIWNAYNALRKTNQTISF